MFTRCLLLFVCAPCAFSRLFRLAIAWFQPTGCYLRDLIELFEASKNRAPRYRDVLQGSIRAGVEEEREVTKALAAVVAAIERQLRERNIACPPDAWLLGEVRAELIDALLGGFLGNVAAVDWRMFRQLMPVLRPHGLDGLEAAVGLSLPQTISSGVTADVLANLLERSVLAAPSVLFARLTRSTAGHVIFRSQLISLAEGEFGTPPLEAANLLARHTPSGVRAIFVGRLIRTRPDLDSTERDALIEHATRHVHRLLDDVAVRYVAVLLLRLAYYRVHHDPITRPQLQRLRIVDFRPGAAARAGTRSAPGA
jgi:hypothetical protein